MHVYINGIRKTTYETDTNQIKTESQIRNSRDCNAHTYLRKTIR